MSLKFLFINLYIQSCPKRVYSILSPVCYRSNAGLSPHPPDFSVGLLPGLCGQSDSEKLPGATVLVTRILGSKSH